MVRQLNALAVLTENPSSIPSTHMAAYNYPELQFQRPQSLLLASTGTRHACNVCARTHHIHIYVQAKHSYI